MKTIRLLTISATCVALALAACHNDDTKPDNKGIMYIVTATSEGNGTVMAEPREASAGQIVTITATPDEGNIFTQWNLLEGDIILDKPLSGDTRFTMPASNVSIEGKFDVKTSMFSS